MTTPLLEVKDLTVIASTETGDRTIVDDVSFSLDRGEVFGLVGESGCGKTVTCRALLRLFPTPNLRITSGAILLEGNDLLKLSKTDLTRIRGAKIGMIFQNPSSHLDPVMCIGAQIAESILHHRQVSANEARSEARALLRQVGIPDPELRFHDFPHQFSGGMRQRAMIALALACDPDVLIADEPTTALDVTVQAQILRLLLDLRQSRGLSIILISHNLGVVAQTCDSISVMYAGRICESAPKRELLRHPTHPYTARLMACQPARSESGSLPNIPGQPPTYGELPVGCAFGPRCELVFARCRIEAPALLRVRENHLAACHLIDRAGS
jgi:peptide/nickel transport system ATP-binding protein